MEKYDIVKVVGQGSYGKALLCRRKTDSRQCIIKQISTAKMSRKEALLTEQEATLLKRLQHPNIVTFWESFFSRNALHIVMDFADGGDLDNYIKNHAKKHRGKIIDEKQVLNLFVQLSLAIKHIHDRKILHRDLKSQNVFLTSKGLLKLGDFGVSRVLRHTVELAATQIGTPYYMSPEIMNNQRYNSKTDIWSLGVILYELMCQRMPFDGRSMRELCQRIARSQPAAAPSTYSKELREVLRDTLIKNPKQRPGINSLLQRQVIKSRISEYLGETHRQQEFSHTILHGANVLKAQPPVSAPPLNSNLVVKDSAAVIADRIKAKREEENRQEEQRIHQQQQQLAAQKQLEQVRAARERERSKQQQRQQDRDREREAMVQAAHQKLKEEQRQREIKQQRLIKQRQERAQQEAAAAARKAAREKELEEMQREKRRQQYEEKAAAIKAARAEAERAAKAAEAQRQRRKELLQEAERKQKMQEQAVRQRALEARRQAREEYERGKVKEKEMAAEKEAARARRHSAPDLVPSNPFKNIVEKARQPVREKKLLVSQSADNLQSIPDSNGSELVVVSKQLPSSSWLTNLEHQMGNLQEQMKALQEGASPRRFQNFSPPQKSVVSKDEDGCGKPSEVKPEVNGRPLEIILIPSSNVDAPKSERQQEKMKPRGLRAPLSDPVPRKVPTSVRSKKMQGIVSANDAVKKVAKVENNKKKVQPVPPLPSPPLDSQAVQQAADERLQYRRKQRLSQQADLRAFIHAQRKNKQKGIELSTIDEEEKDLPEVEDSGPKANLSKAEEQRIEFRRDMMEKKKKFRLQAQKRKNDALLAGKPLEVGAPRAQLSGAAASGNVLVLTPINKPPPAPANQHTPPIMLRSAWDDCSDVNINIEPASSNRFSDDEKYYSVSDKDNDAGDKDEFDQYAAIQKFAAQAAAQHDDLQYSVLIAQMQAILRIVPSVASENGAAEVDLMNMDIDVAPPANPQTDNEIDIENAIPRSFALQDDDDEFEEEEIVVDESEGPDGKLPADAEFLGDDEPWNESDNEPNEESEPCGTVDEFEEDHIFAVDNGIDEKDKGDEAPLISAMLRTVDINALDPSFAVNRQLEDRQLEDINSDERKRRLQQEELREYLVNALGERKVDECLELLLSASNNDSHEDFDDAVLNRLEEILGAGDLHHMDDLMELLMITMY